MAGAVGLLCAVLFAALLWLPGRIDWDHYRDAVAEIAGERLGRSVTVQGRLRLSLLPETRLEADGLRVGPLADQVELSARAIRLRLDPWRLLLGQLSVREVVLLDADISLPWPPAALPGLPPLGAITALDARIEESRLRIAGLAIDGLSLRLLAGGPADALRVAGRFQAPGGSVAFRATLGRAGDDGVAPLDITAQLGQARLAARGVLLADGGFEGQFEASGPDLAAVLPAPPGAFAARARLTATGEAIALDAMALDAGGETLRGTASLRLGPTARVDAQLAASRLDLDSWTRAIRAAAGGAPLALRLEAAAATFLGVALRDLAVAVQTEGGRITVTEAGALLPGDARISATGAGAGESGEWALRLESRRGSQTIAALAPLGFTPTGVPLPDGPLSTTFRVALDGRQTVLNDIALSAGALRLRGNATLRAGPRPALALGLEASHLVLDPWLALAAEATGIDLEVRLAADQARLGPLALERLQIDGAVEAGRANLRRATARLDGADLSASGTGTLSPPRVQEAVLEAHGGPLGAVLRPAWPSLPASLAALPLRLRIAASGPPDQLLLRIDAEADDLRAEAQLTTDPRTGTANGWATLRHPSAARMLGAMLPIGGAEWLGEGSLSAIAQLALRPGQWAADQVTLVAGGMRGRGPLMLERDHTGMRLSGGLAIERASLPPIRAVTLPPGLRLALGLQVETMELLPGMPALTALRAAIEAEGTRSRLQDLEAQFSGGTLRGNARRIDDTWRLELSLEAAQPTGPLTGLALDLGQARADGSLALEARGAGPAGWRATMTGEAALLLQDGTLLGFDLGAARDAAALPNHEVEAALRAALAGGATPFTRLALPWRLERGRWSLVPGALLETAVGDVPILGGLDGWLDLLAELPMPQGPPVPLRLRGPPASAELLPLPGSWLRWRAEAELERH